MNVTTASAQAETNSAGASLHAADVTATGSLRSADGFSPRRSVRGLQLRGPAGRLEALLNDGAPDAPFAALVCHPHPLGGGTLHNKVVYRAMKALNDPAWGLGFPVLRFNFRGTGLSEGTHHGQEEVGDVLAALDWLEEEFHLPVIAAGFSFGAATVLRACCAGDGPRNVCALVALGLPVEAQGRAYDYSFLRNAVTPKLFISGDHDMFAPAARLKQIADSSADPKHLVLIPGADHFFTSHPELMQRALSGWLKEQLL